MENRLRQLIDRTLAAYIKQNAVEIPLPVQFDLTTTKDAAHGDFATNVAFKLARYARSKPIQIAGELTQLLNAGSIEPAEKAFIQRVEIAGGGFINFYLQKASLAEILLTVRQQDRHYGESQFGCGRKILLEFVSANPTGPLTIAHGRQAAIGDVLARILQATGHQPHKEYYLNDAGRQMRLLGESVLARYMEEFHMESVFPEDGYQGDYIRELAKEIIKTHRDTLLKKPKEETAAFCTEFAQNAMMAWIKQDLKQFDVTFDSYFSEKSLYEKNLVDDALDYLRKQDFLYEQDGALWFRSTDFGDDKDRVVKKSSGEFTYLAPDIAYHRSKFERGFTRLINLWGPDHHGYIARLKAACRGLGHPSDDIMILIVQLTTLFRQGAPVRMSTRAGEFVTLRELMEDVGVDAARFFFIMRRVESPLDFDLDLAKQKSQDNPVYYLQYAHARTASLLKFADRSFAAQAKLELLESAEETEVMKIISDYPKALIQTCELLEPHRLADYLCELAASFHKFYQKHRVVTENGELTQARLILVDAVRIVLRNGLALLGISQPDSM